jgi:ferrochelatase
VEEIEMENRAQFLASGGKKFVYVPALNARPEHSKFLADLIAQHCEGWTDGARVLAQAGAARGTSA